MLYTRLKAGTHGEDSDNVKKIKKVVIRPSKSSRSIK